MYLVPPPPPPNSNFLNITYICIDFNFNFFTGCGYRCNIFPFIIQVLSKQDYRKTDQHTQ